MKRKIPSFFTNLAGFFAILIICIAVSFAFVYPLWKFSTSFKTVYTWTVLLLIAVYLLFLLIKSMLKKSKLENLQLLINLILIPAGLISFIYLALFSKRLMAIVVIIVTAAIITTANILINRFKHEN